MLTNKDIRVENGNIVINGDKYPLDGQSPEAIMAIVEDNSDTTPTENSDAPITSGGVFTADKEISDTIGDITQTGVTGADVATQLGTLKNSVGAVKDLYTSTVSFADAGTQAGINYGEHADLILTNISTLSTGIFSMDTPGPKIGVVLFKNTDDYFAGIILYYFASNTQKPLYFVYQNGTYGIKTI